ncbi:MAG: 4Fe-4S binding protein [Treponema sp.]|jgi:ferredoxin|nr:4Fe-4S binding protein [Treponema sp.]
MNEGLVYTGVPSKEELAACPGVPGAERLGRGRVAVIECVQRIPCNPCVAACPFGAISISGGITELPVLNGEVCTGCGKCVPRCPGLAIFLVDMTYSETEAAVDFPYEYLPLPAKGDTVDAVNRAGERVCSGRVLQALDSPGYDGTRVIRLAVPKEYAGEVRSMGFLKRTGSGNI